MNENTNRYETSLPLKGNFVLRPDNYNELCRKHLQVVACPKHAIPLNPQ